MLVPTRIVSLGFPEINAATPQVARNKRPKPMMPATTGTTARANAD
jgi:hypothetical protein